VRLFFREMLLIPGISTSQSNAATGCRQTQRGVSLIMAAIHRDPQMFNSLPTLEQANDNLLEQLSKLGSRGDLAELRDIYERHQVGDRLGLVLLHRHFSIEDHEHVVEYGHVSTPWPLLPESPFAGGQTVPRSWRFIDQTPVPYEFGFNHPQEQLYDVDGLPDLFVDDVARFLKDTSLDAVLGVCTLGPEIGRGRIETTRGRVSITVPISDELNARLLDSDHTPAVWAFGCNIGMENTTIKLARACWVCPKPNCR